MRVRLLLLGLLATVTLCAVPAAGAAKCTGLPKHSNMPVVDVANVVPPEVEAFLSADLMAYHLLGHEALVAAVVPDLGGDDVSSYAARLFDCWGVGDADSDNGVLILVAMAERRVRIELGAGLEGRIGERELEAALGTMTAPLRRGDVGGALRAASVSVAASLGHPLPDLQRNPEGLVPKLPPGVIPTARPGARPSARPSAGPGDVTDEVETPSVPDFDVPAFGPFGSRDGGSGSGGSGLGGFVPFVIGFGVLSALIRGARALFGGGGGGSGSRQTWRGGFPGAGVSTGTWGGGLFSGGSWHDGGSHGSSSGHSGGSHSSGSSGGSSGGGGSFGGGSSGGGGASGSW